MIDVNNLDGTNNIEKDIIEIKEMSKIKKIISNLYMYDNDPKELTDIYTDIFFQDNVSFILTKLSQDKIFFKHFPEFYVPNSNGENVINCQQNNSYHKYGVFKHILVTIEAVGNSQITMGDWQKKLLKWTMFLHDIGKPYVKVYKDDGTDSFLGHEDKSVELAKNILDRFYFTDEEKNIILTFIKYHDKFLNSEEITYDNMKMLASELNNNKEIFYLLIDVKDADAKAKSDEVYEKYKEIREKYIDFINTYFIYSESEKNKNNIKNSDKQDKDENESQKNNNISSELMNKLLDDIISKKNIYNLFQPVIDLKEKKVYGYEVYSLIDTDLNVDMGKIINYSKEVNLYDKIQQILFMNKIVNFDNINSKESNRVFAKIDLNSYKNYINKPRIYELMEKNNLVVKFVNYENIHLSTIQENIKIIHDNKGLVALENFGMSSNIKLDDLNFLDIDYIIPDISLVADISENREKQDYLANLITYSLSNNINIILPNVNDSDTLNTLAGLGARYVIGNYFAKKEKNINMISGTLESMIGELGQDTVV